jgi:hypothetical protein
MVKGVSPTLKTSPGEYPLVVTAEFRRTSDAWQLEGPAVCIPLISSTGHGDAALHRVHYQEGKFALANLLVALLPNDSTICDAKYLYHLLMTQKDELLVPLMQGTANVSLKERDIAGVEITLPSLTDQRRVVARIEELTVQIHEARTLRHQATEETESLMAGEEKRIWPDDALVGAPTLESVCTFLARGKQSEQGESDHFLIKTQHVQQDRYLTTMMRLAPHVAAKVKAEAIVQDGDTLIACSAAGCLGRVARFRGEGKTASTDTHVAIARSNPEVVHSDYLYAFLRGAQGQHQLRSRERGDWQREKISFRLTELNLNDLRKVPISVPPLAEQRRIVAELDALQSEVDALKQLQAETAAELDALLPAILDRAFKGEL